MPLEQTHVPYEVLIRFNPDGTIKGAHQIDIEQQKVDGNLIAEREMPAAPVDPALLGRHIGADSAANLARIADLETQLAASHEAKEAAENDRDEAVRRLDPPLPRALFMQVLSAAGLLDKVNGFVSNLADDDEVGDVTGREFKMVWAAAPTFRSNAPAVAAVMAALQIDDRQKAAIVREVRRLSQRPPA